MINIFLIYILLTLLILIINVYRENKDVVCGIKLKINQYAI